MFVEWSSEDHMCDAFRLDICELSEGICEWHIVNSKSTTRSDPVLNFKVFFAPRVHWTTISTEITASTEVKGAICHSESKDIEITFKYFTKSTFSQQLGTHLEVHLLHLRLRLLHPEVTMETFHRYENHKLSLLLRVFRRDGLMTIRSVYVGRAQEIQTTEHSGTRVYTWTPRQGAIGFDGIGFRRVSDLGDIDAIGRSRLSLISPRQSAEYVMDNDDFHNASKVLPVELLVNESLNLEFFNLKFTPPKCLEIQVPWREIIDVPTLFTTQDPMRKVMKRRFSLGPKQIPEILMARYEKQIVDEVANSALVTLRVTYERIDADKISIREIKLIMRKYLLSLHYMGENVALKTV